jgi:hypothetical protein
MAGTAGGGGGTAAPNQASRTFPERSALAALLEFVRGSVSEPCARLPAAAAAFAAEASLVLMDPGGLLYKRIGAVQRWVRARSTSAAG